MHRQYKTYKYQRYITVLDGKKCGLSSKGQASSIKFRRGQNEGFI